MNETSLFDRLRKFPDFASMPEEAAAGLGRESRVQWVDRGRILATQGSRCEFFPLILSGQARIYTMDEEGREVTLYRIGPGEGCVLAGACSLSGEPLPGFAIAEAEGEGLFLPCEVLRARVDGHPFWRDYVFALVARQLGKVVATTNEIAFQRLDARIAGFLVNGAERSKGVVHATHQMVALDVGTRREVASRILKSFESDGLVALERGLIRLLDRRALAERAGIVEGFPLLGDISN